MGILSFDFKSETIKETTRVSIILPETEDSPYGYTDGHRYPVLYLLHDNCGDNTDFIRYSQVELFAEEAQIAVVMPELGCSFCSNQRHGNGKDNFSYLTEELPEVIRRILPVSETEGDLYVAGIGTGGYGAFKWALSHPEEIVFAAAICGGYGADQHELLRNPNYLPDENSYFNQTFGNMNEYLTGPDNLVNLLVSSNKSSLPRILSLCSESGHEKKNCRDFIATAKQSGVEIDFEEIEGTSDWYSWNLALKRVFSLLAQS